MKGKSSPGENGKVIIYPAQPPSPWICRAGIVPAINSHSKFILLIKSILNIVLESVSI